MLRRYFAIPLLYCLIGFNCLCTKSNSGNNNNNGNNTGAAIPDAEFWMTTSNGITALEKQSPLLSFGTKANAN